MKFATKLYEEKKKIHPQGDRSAILRNQKTQKIEYFIFHNSKVLLIFQFVKLFLSS
jgi:hypothetical protein